MDWVETSLNKNTIVQRFFDTWKTFIEVIPDKMRPANKQRESGMIITIVLVRKKKIRRLIYYMCC